MDLAVCCQAVRLLQVVSHCNHQVHRDFLITLYNNIGLTVSCYESLTLCAWNWGKERVKSNYRGIETSKRSRCKCRNSWRYQSLDMMYVVELRSEIRKWVIRTAGRQRRCWGLLKGCLITVHTVSRNWAIFCNDTITECDTISGSCRAFKISRNVTND
jgi:hypothetical protein